MCCLVNIPERNWSEMSPELLECISDRLSLLDYFIFRWVCKGWLLAPSGRKDITRFSKDKPWLMLYGLDGIDRDKCYLYSCSHLKWCTFLFPQLQGATCEESMSGWLLVRQNEHLFFSNPFTLEKIDLPEYPTKISDHICTFVSLPTYEDCTVFVISRRDASTLEICSCRVRDGRWETDILNVSQDQLSPIVDAYSHTCDDHGRCSCKAKNNIYIASTSLRLSYDFINKKHQLYNVTGVDSKPTGLYKEIKALHSTNWLSKFGKGGVSLSFCGFSMSMEGSAGYKRHVCEVSAEGKDMTPAKRVRAAWIEPKFGRTV